MESERRPNEFRMPRWNDLPPVPLYLDQVLALLDEWLGPYLNGHKRKIMTRTRINNYVKLKFIPAPVNKKYDQVTVASLFVIAVLKSVFSIEEIACLIQLALSHSERQVAYDGFCDYLEDAVTHAYNRTTMEREQNLRSMMMQIMSHCAFHMERMPLVRDVELIRNIVYSGVWMAWNAKQKKGCIKDGEGSV